MTVELWMGREYEHAHEMKALSEFLTSMIELYGEDEKLYVVLANFFCGGEEIDLAVLKRAAVLIIELKDAGGKVVGGENGNWTVTNPDGTNWTMNSGRSRNPYEQARAYRYAVIDQLSKNRFDLLPRSARGAAFGPACGGNTTSGI